MLSLEGIFYTVTKANIYAAHMFPQEYAPHFLACILHPTPFPFQGADWPLCTHTVLGRLFQPPSCIQECRLYYCCHLHSVPVCCSSIVIQERPHHSFLLGLVITQIFECQWSPGYITCCVCGVTKSSVSEPERVWSADAREVFEPCSVMDEAAALQKEISKPYLSFLLSVWFHWNSHCGHFQVNLRMRQELKCFEQLA